MGDPTILHSEGWWKCCQCAREMNPDWYDVSCSDCGHSKCDGCQEVSGGIRSHPKNGLNGMLVTHNSFDCANCLLDAEKDCDCECGSCTCKPPRNPPPRPTQGLAGTQYRKNCGTWISRGARP
ncbi:hypothetical protein BDZ45DRAFT_681871 [Acephala macrosclerotiorum]|nr:hypothetical protein BDZ45DRAFT_681871 [Acephala macrosclerotiorum]